MKMGTTRSSSRYDGPTEPAAIHAGVPWMLENTTPRSPSGRDTPCRPADRRLLGWWNEQIGRHTEAGTQPLNHRHAQPLLAPQDFTDPARRAEDRHHVSAREAVLVHEVADQFRDVRWPAGPFAFLIGSNQPRLRLQPHAVGRII